MEYNYELLCTASPMEVLVLKGILSDNDIPFIEKNSINSGIMAGFYGGEQVQLYVHQHAIDAARVLLEDFKNNPPLD